MPDQSSRPVGGGAPRRSLVGRFGARLRRSGAQESLTPRDGRFLERIHDARHLLDGEWTWDVFVALHAGPLQYSQLLDAIRGSDPSSRWPGRTHRFLHESTLSQTLQRLEDQELVAKRREDGFPFRTVYQLAPAAGNLLVVVSPLVEWAEEHAELVRRVQQRRRGEPRAGE